jgi:myo-inositol 2-dehydrogenase / D-chiro-inositol 1-dehydrogenase
MKDIQHRNVPRRSFLKTSAGLAAAPGLLVAQTSSDTLRIAFIGVGNRGSYLLQSALKAPSVKVVALCDLNPETLKRAAQMSRDRGHEAAAYSDYRKMLDEVKDLDAVFIATPTDSHKDIAIAALEVGKHVYAEKPMALTPEECRIVLNAASSAKGIYQAGFQLRHDPNRRAAIEFIHKGGLGRVLFCQGYRHTGDLPRETEWYFNAARSGDSIVEQACHILDLFAWAIGKPPLRAFGSGGVSLYKDIPPGRTTMDNYSLIYEFPEDVRVCFSHIYFDPPGFSGIKERVYGAGGAIDLADAKWIERGNRGEIKLTVPDAGANSTYLSVEDFLENARRGRKPLNNAESAGLSTLMAMLGRKAIYEKRVVEWAEVAASLRVPA